MSTSPPRYPVLRWLRWPLRILLGLFVLAQGLFILAYNILDFAEDKNVRYYLKSQRYNWRQFQKDDPERSASGKVETGAMWERVQNLPFLGAKMDDWLDKQENSELGKTIKTLARPVKWWAYRTGQDQGWGLFAPDTGEYACFIRVEMRWDDDAEPGQPPVVPEHEPMLIKSDNEPDDIHHFVRWGKFRLRRYESALDTPLRWEKGETREQRLARWQQRARRTVWGDEDHAGESKEIMLYLSWKLKCFKEAHPDLPEPRQVVLWSVTWEIPRPPLPKPWDWEEVSNEPIVRWRPRRHPPQAGSLELFLHVENRFEGS